MAPKAALLLPMSHPRKCLQDRHVKFRESIVPRTGDTQFILFDPDDAGVELNFPKS